MNNHCVNCEYSNSDGNCYYEPETEGIRSWVYAMYFYFAKCDERNHDGKCDKYKEKE
jgi:hypothetical protein